MGSFSALLFLAWALLGGCVSASRGVDTTVPADSRSDGEYAPVMEKWYREANVISAFQKRVEVKAVLLTGEFRKAYIARFVRMRGEGNGQFDETVGNRIGVLVSLYSPERDFESLEDRRLWTVTMRYGKSELRNAEIRLLPEKALLNPFFPFISLWSKEFLIVFDPQGGDAGLPSEVALSLRSSLADIEIKWN